MSRADDLASIMAKLAKDDKDIGYRSGVVTAWDPTTGDNTITIAGSPINDVPFLSRTEALAITIGDVVGILRVKSQYFVLGRISVSASDLVVRNADGEIAVTIRTGGIVVSGFGRIEAPDGGSLLMSDNAGQLRTYIGGAPGGDNWLQIVDAHNNMLFSDDPSGLLIRTPYMGVPLYPGNSTGDIRYPGTSFVEIWHGTYTYTHPGLAALARIWVSSPGTLPTAQVQLKINGAQVGSTATTSSATSATTNFGASIHDLGSLGMTPNFTYDIAIEARISANSGTDRLVSVLPHGITKRGLT